MNLGFEGLLPADINLDQLRGLNVLVRLIRKPWLGLLGIGLVRSPRLLTERLIWGLGQRRPFSTLRIMWCTGIGWGRFD